MRPTRFICRASSEEAGLGPLTSYMRPGLAACAMPSAASACCP